jgi:hypothetical protein
VQFTHDPSAGLDVWQRLSVTRPSDLRIVRTGRFSVAQQTDELRQLDALAARPAAAAAATDAAPAQAPAADPVDRLAGWLLQQAGLPTPPAGN